MITMMWHPGQLSCFSHITALVTRGHVSDRRQETGRMLVNVVKVNKDRGGVSRKGRAEQFLENEEKPSSDASHRCYGPNSFFFFVFSG